MALARATYGEGGYQTDVSGASAGFGGAPPELAGFMELARRRAQESMAQQRRRAELEDKLLKEQLRQAKQSGKAPKLSLREKNTRDAQLAAQQAAAQAQSAQARALTDRAPTRTSFGLGYIAPNQLDVAKLTGAQRQVFLPGAAGLSEMPTPEESTRGARAGFASPEFALGQQELAQRAPGIAEAARQTQIMRQYPGMARRMFGQG